MRSDRDSRISGDIFDIFEESTSGGEQPVFRGAIASPFYGIDSGSGESNISNTQLRFEQESTKWRGKVAGKCGRLRIGFAHVNLLENL
jgi:hypothetical protein